MPVCNKFALQKKFPCITLIGMPGAGKTTIGKLLAARLGWAFMDSDHLMESLYGVRLQDIADAQDKESFLDLECAMVCAIRASRCVIATGGSVVYRQKAIAHLASLGPIIRLHLSAEEAKRRIAANPERGIAIAPGQTFEDLYCERQSLYRAAANIVCDVETTLPAGCVDWILGNVPNLND